jgi:hypothetical protein
MWLSVQVKIYSYEYFRCRGRLPKTLVVADHFGMSISTLYRMLRREGNSFKMIKGSIRKEIMIFSDFNNREVYANPSLIGYSSSRSFVRFLYEQSM